MSTCVLSTFFNTTFSQRLVKNYKREGAPDSFVQGRRHWSLGEDQELEVADWLRVMEGGAW